MKNYEDLFYPTFLQKVEKRPPLPRDATVTMAYIPLQEDIEAFDEDKALRKGTLFPVLNKPFTGRDVKDEK